MSKFTVPSGLIKKQSNVVSERSTNVPDGIQESKEAKEEATPEASNGQPT